MNATDALAQIQKVKPGPYDSIELVEGRHGKLVYMAYLSQPVSDDIVIIDGNTGVDLSGSYQSRYDLAAVLASVSKTHEGEVVAARKVFLPETGYVYLVELESNDDLSPVIQLTIRADNLKIIDSRPFEETEPEDVETEYDIVMDDPADDFSN